MGIMQTIQPASFDIAAMAAKASALEQIIFDVSAALDAIRVGELLAALPADEGDIVRHNIGCNLLESATRALARLDTLPGTDLSIELAAFAPNAG